MATSFAALHTVDDLTMDLEDEDEDKKDRQRRGRRRPARQMPARQARQGGTGVRRVVPRRERRGHPQLRGALPRRRDHLHLVRGIRGQPGHQQTHGQETTDALEPPRRTPTTADPHPGTQRHPRPRLPTLVPRLHPHPRPARPGRVASHGLSRSPTPKDSRLPGRGQTARATITAFKIIRLPVLPLSWPVLTQVSAMSRDINLSAMSRIRTESANLLLIHICDVSGDRIRAIQHARLYAESLKGRIWPSTTRTRRPTPLSLAMSQLA